MFILDGRACDQGCSLEINDRIASAYSSVPENPEGELEVEMSWVSSLKDGCMRSRRGSVTPSVL